MLRLRQEMLRKVYLFRGLRQGRWAYRHSQQLRYEALVRENLVK